MPFCAVVFNWVSAAKLSGAEIVNKVKLPDPSFMSEYCNKRFYLIQILLFGWKVLLIPVLVFDCSNKRFYWSQFHCLSAVIKGFIWPQFYCLSTVIKCFTWSQFHCISTIIIIDFYLIPLLVIGFILSQFCCASTVITGFVSPDSTFTVLVHQWLVVPDPNFTVLVQL